MKKIIFILISLSTIGLTACEDVIDVSLNQGETLLVVDGKITDETMAHSIKLSTTAPYFDNTKTPVISGALVKLREFDGNNVLLQTDTLLENSANAGEYLTQKINKGIIGNTYELTVEALGETYTASSTMQRIPEIDSISFKYQSSSFPELNGWHVYYNGPELSGAGDNYLFKIYRNNKLYSKPSQLYFSSDDLIDGNYIANVDVTPEVFEQGDTIKIEMNTMSKDQYYFYVEMSTQVNNGGIFASPPANVRTNIKNINPSRKKAVGYFSANALKRKERIIQ